MDFTVDRKLVHAATGGGGFDPARPAVLFVHGAAMDHSVWALQTRYFAHHGKTVLALDLPGHGRSEGPPLASIEAIADWLDRLLDAAGLKHAALVGHSMGALAALEMAARHPARVRALVLVGAAAAMPVNTALLETARDDPERARDMIVGWAFATGAQIGGAQAPGLWMTGGALRLLERAAVGVLANDFEACNGYRQGHKAATGLTCPVLVLSGEADRMTPAREGRALAKLIRSAVLVVTPGAGHMIMIERPDATLDALKEFLA